MVPLRSPAPSERSQLPTSFLSGRCPQPANPLSPPRAREARLFSSHPARPRAERPAGPRLGGATPQQLASVKRWWSSALLHQRDRLEVGRPRKEINGPERSQRVARREKLDVADQR